MRRVAILVAAAAAVASLAPVAAESDQPYVGEVKIFAYDFCPTGWHAADGSLVAIAENDVLFTLIGTTYGGDGETTFALPDLRGRLPMGAGQGPGLSNRAIGEQGGVEAVTLTTAQMPAHTHPAIASTQLGNTASPINALSARKARTLLYRAGSAANATMAPDAIGSAGGSQPHTNLPPYLAMTWCIALEGIYPSRP